MLPYHTALDVGLCMTSPETAIDLCPLLHVVHGRPKTRGIQPDPSAASNVGKLSRSCTSGAGAAAWDSCPMRVGGMDPAWLSQYSGKGHWQGPCLTCRRGWLCSEQLLLRPSTTRRDDTPSGLAGECGGLKEARCPGLAVGAHCLPWGQARCVQQLNRAAVAPLCRCTAQGWFPIPDKRMAPC